MKRAFLSLFLTVLAIFHFDVNGTAQSVVSNPDSMLRELAKPQEDSTRALTLIHICRYYQNSDLDSLKKYAQQCINVSDEAAFPKGQGTGHNMLGIAYMYEGNNASALTEYEIAYNYYSGIAYRKGMANATNNIALIYSATAQYDLALEYQIKASSLYKQDGNWIQEANSLNNTGLIYINQMRYEEAFPFLMKSVQLMKENGEVLALRNPYNNIGLVYQSRGMIDSSILYFELAIDLYKLSGDNYNLSGCYNNLALNYDALKDSARALDYNRKALELRIRNSDIPGIATSWINIGMVYGKFHETDSAKQYVRKAIHLADSIKMYAVLHEGYKQLSLIDSANNQMDSAYFHLQMSMVYRDSMVNEETDQRLADMRVKYDTEDIKQQSELKDEQLKTEKTIRWFMIGIGVFVVIALIIVSLSWRAVRRTNRLLATQKLEILQKNATLNSQNIIIGEQKQEITDSINYAFTIQSALLPSAAEMQRDLPGSFVFFAPRNIISGDFYISIKADDATIFAVADCTGHGVPGAMMSMIGVEELQKAITNSSDPGAILAEVNRSVRNLLHQSDEEGTSRDGMDIALCVLKGNTLTYAGAHRPLWIVRNNKLIETKATKMSIGGTTPDSQLFQNHVVELQPGDMVYLSSDGYADQFGGIEGKKLMTKNLKEFLCSIVAESPQTQLKLLQTHFQEWKGKNEQVDDVCVLGVRI